jgi:hypothetical protein
MGTDNFQLGQEFSFEAEIGEAELDRFAALSGDRGRQWRGRKIACLVWLRKFFKGIVPFRISGAYAGLSFLDEVIQSPDVFLTTALPQCRGGGAVRTRGPGFGLFVQHVAVAVTAQLSAEALVLPRRS